MKVICDIEANGLLIEATKIHCIVCQDYETGMFYKFSDTPLTDLSIKEDFIKFAAKVDTWVGHNWLAYDLFVLNRLLGLGIKARQVEDTLVMSRLFTSGLYRKHSLEEWMKRMNIPGIEKVKNEDWSVLTPNMLHRCTVDTRGNTALYKRMLQEGRGFTKASIRLEHNTQYLLTKQKIRGVYIDVRKAEKLLRTCNRQAKSIRDLVQKEYPPMRKNLRTLWPRMVVDKATDKKRMHGQDKRSLERNLHNKNRDGSYTLYIMQEFNLDSPTQCVTRLNIAGWKPTEFNKLTKTQKKAGEKIGTPKICEENLETLPDNAPQGAKLISDYKMFIFRKRVAESWLDAVDTEGRLHGDVFSVGAWTQRCSHSKPQTANIAAVKKGKDDKPLMGKEGRYGYESRECWTVDDIDTRRIVGVDAKSIQLRILAHYMEDPDYTHRILNEDPHQVHQGLLGLPEGDEGRAIAKRWMYAWLLGAGYLKLGRLMRGGYGDAVDAELTMLDRLPGLVELKYKQKSDARRGWFRGLDGRKVPAKSEHLVMSGYLQAGEAIVMKQAYVNSCVRLKRLDADIVLFVHDEFQADSHLTCVEECGIIMVEEIDNTTDYFNLRCPMKGDVPKVGLSWAETH